MADKENGSDRKSAAERPVDEAATADVEEATVLSVSDGTDPLAADNSEASRRRGVSRFMPAFGRKRAQSQPDSGHKPANSQADGAKPGGIMDRLDSFVFFLVRAAVFGLTAAACGVLAVLFFRNFIDTKPGGPDLFAEFSRLDEAVSTAQAELQAIQTVLAASGTAAADVETLRAEVAESGSAAAAEAKALSARAERLESALTSLAAGLTAAEDSIAQLETARETAGADPLMDEMRVRMQDVQTRLDALEWSPAPPAAGQDQTGADFQSRSSAEDSRLLARINALETRLSEVGALRAQIDSIAARAAQEPETAAVVERLARLEASQSASSAALSPLETRISRLEDRVRDLANSGTVPAAQARGLSLIGVRAAAETGAPYASLLGNSGIAKEEIPEIVLAHAETGIATLEGLRTEFGSYSRAALKAPDTDSDSSRIAGMLRQLVQVRPLSPQEGDDPGSILSRAEDALAMNDLSAALDQLDVLPEPGREAMSEWIGAAEARLAVLAAIELMMNRIETE